MHRAFSTVDDVKDVESDESQSPAKYVVSHEDFKWVKRLLPPSVIPDPPKHSKYPTPSGWSPPSGNLFATMIRLVAYVLQ